MRKTLIAFGLVALFAAGPIASHADDGGRLFSITLAQIKALLGSAATAQGNLGLGTASLQNTGTSGANIPLLSTANTWSATQTTNEWAAVGAGADLRFAGRDGGNGFAWIANTGTAGLYDLTAAGYRWTLNSGGEMGLSKVTASGTAPGAGLLKLAVVAGTNTGTCKIIAYAGTSTTPTTVLDNIGSGC